jgi:uncharacterized membrane protein
MVQMISQALTHAVTSWPLPPELLAAFIAMLPVLEIRAAIPVGHEVLALSWFSSFAWSYVGSLVPGLAILYATEPVLGFCNERSRTCKRVIGGVLERTRHHFAQRHEKFGRWFLLIVTAIPFPGFGIWSGALAAVIFGVDKYKAIKLMLLGNLVACFIVLLAAMGVVKAVSFL